MSELEDVKLELRRMQALLAAQEHLLLAIFDRLPDHAAVLATFDRGSEAVQNMLLFDSHFSDQEIDDGAEAISFLRAALENVMRGRTAGPTTRETASNKKPRTRSF
jgi:hypothetical protein